MKQLIAYLLAFAMVMTLSACKKEASILGVWEAPMEISVLGVNTEGETAAAVTRFTFREDGTGTWETDMPEEKYPDTVQEFEYTLEEGTLTLYNVQTNPQTFTVDITEEVLKLDGRADFILNRVS